MNPELLSPFSLSLLYLTRYPSLARTVASGRETETEIDRHSWLPGTGVFAGL